MPEPVILTTDPTALTPEYTVQVAAALAEAIRVLNHCTLSSGRGLDVPADAYGLLGSLQITAERLPQLCRQIAAFLRAQDFWADLASTSALGPAECVNAAEEALVSASMQADALAGSLRRAQQAVSGLYVKEGHHA